MSHSPDERVVSVIQRRHRDDQPPSTTLNKTINRSETTAAKRVRQGDAARNLMTPSTPNSSFSPEIEVPLPMREVVRVRTRGRRCWTHIRGQMRDHDLAKIGSRENNTTEGPDDTSWTGGGLLETHSMNPAVSHKSPYSHNSAENGRDESAVRRQRKAGQFAVDLDLVCRQIPERRQIMHGKRVSGVSETRVSG